MIFQNLSIAIVLATTYLTIVNAQGDSDNTIASIVRTVKPWDDIASAIDSDAVDAKATFTISASHMDFGQDAILPPDVEASIDESTFSFDVNVATPAVTAETLIRDEEGNLVRMGELAYSLLVPSSTDRESGTMALISVDHKTGETNGIVQKKDSKAMHIHQSKGRSIVAEEEAEFVPPAWACTVAEEHEEDPLRHRHLEEDGHDHHHHDHDHHDHNHHHHEHDHDHGLDGNDLPGSFENLRKSLRGADLSKIGKRRQLQDANVGYSYQVDVYIEFDQELVDNNGGTLEKAYAYINSLVTMANQIYENEVDTHLHVFQMEQTGRYNNIKSASDGLKIVRNTWGGNKWSNPNVDLHHVLSGKDLGGGIAYVGVLCNKNYGFGVSTSIKGSYINMNAGVTWDSMVFTHEIGHNFNSGHTFNGYSPAVDPCMQNSECPDYTLEDDSATLMSYCHMCGGFRKVEYTFGGEYKGSGNKSQLSNWKRSNKLGNTKTSTDPQRVPHKMRQHVSTRGNCVALPPPAGPTSEPTPAPTKPPSPPTTPPPTFEPEVAEYDEELGGPKCSSLTSHCKSGNLLEGRGTFSGKPESNTPNSMDDCVDGNGGAYEDDESIEAIELKTLSGNRFQAGEEVQISVKVYAWGNGDKDYLDLWYAEDASDPEWEFITTKQPSGGGHNTITATYELPDSNKVQAVRGVFRYSQSGAAASSACPGGSWTDVDAISIVTVESEGLEEPSDGETTVDGEGNTEKKKRRDGKKKRKKKNKD